MFGTEGLTVGKLGRFACTNDLRRVSRSVDYSGMGVLYLPGPGAIFALLEVRQAHLDTLAAVGSSRRVFSVQLSYVFERVLVFY